MRLLRVCQRLRRLPRTRIRSDRRLHGRRTFLRIYTIQNKKRRKWEVAAYEIGRQLIRSGTSITANYEEAKGAFSKDDFTYKLNTAFKEARETNLWLRLLNDSKIMKDDQVKEVIKESEEIRNILGKGVKTAKSRSTN